MRKRVASPPISSRCWCSGQLSLRLRFPLKWFPIDPGIRILKARFFLGKLLEERQEVWASTWDAEATMRTREVFASPRAPNPRQLEVKRRLPAGALSTRRSQPATEELSPADLHCRKIAVLWPPTTFLLHGQSLEHLTSSSKRQLRARQYADSYADVFRCREASPACAKVARSKLVANVCRSRFDVVKAVITHLATPILPRPRLSLPFSSSWCISHPCQSRVANLRSKHAVVSALPRASQSAARYAVGA